MRPRSKKTKQTTVNMQTDMTLREKATRLCALIGVCSLGIYLAACNYGELPVDGEGTGKVELRFSASISNTPATKAVTKQPAQPTMVSKFRVNDAFGLFITRSDGSVLTAGSDDNMKSVLTGTGDSQTWDHFTKGGEQIKSLEVKNNDAVNIKGYYPWIDKSSDGYLTTVTAVPFDLSDTDPTKWTDLLYLSSPAPDVNTSINDLNNSINLQFSHAFCRVTINLTRLSEKSDVQVKAVTIGNAYAGQNIIFNKGTLDLTTGKITGTSGPLTIEQIRDDYIKLDKTNAATYEFLVPPVMADTIHNSDIVFDVTTVENGADKVLTFPLSRTHLNYLEDVGYGFQQGMHNTYNIIYNNSSMNLSLSDWHSVEIEAATLGEKPGILDQFVVFSQSDRDIVFNNITPFPTVEELLLPTDDHLYHTYLGEIAENNNGDKYMPNISSKPGTIPESWSEAVKSEKLYPELYYSATLVAGEAQLPWKDIETGSLLAKQACAGGFTDWRLPRIGECYKITKKGGTKVFWSATEADADSCYAVVYENLDVISKYYVKKYSKQEPLYVRCVRDKYKPTPAK